MAYQWLEMRISEERDRRQREATVQECLPQALDELHRCLAECVQAYAGAFGADSADLQFYGSRIRIIIRDLQGGRWVERAKVDISLELDVPGFQIQRGEDSIVIEVGVLGTDKWFYRDRESDQYLTMEEMTRRVLDRSFFPKLEA